MPYVDLNTITQPELQPQLLQHPTIVACLCAAWCDVCKTYQDQFQALAQQHPEQLFLWIDVEDQADLVGDFEVENFPTLLIQKHGHVTFYGTMQPDTAQLKRLLQSQENQSLAQLQLQTTTNNQLRLWQSTANLLKKLSQS